MKSLADDGRKIGAYSRLLYPNGVAIGEQRPGHKNSTFLTGRHDNLDALVEETRSLLNDNSEITIFEGAVRSGPYLIRADILTKSSDTNNELHLMEVKAKSWDSRKDQNETLLGKRGKSIQANYRPYIQDVAFQKMVVQQAFPEYKVTAWLVMPDKAKTNSQIPNLNTLFQKSEVDFDLDEKSRELILQSGESLLTQVNVDDVADMVLEGKLEFPGCDGQNFRESVTKWADVMSNCASNTNGISMISPPPIGGQCRMCEYRNDMTTDGQRSGFDECWQEVTAATFPPEEPDIPRPVVDLWYGGLTTNKYISAQKYFMEDLSPSDLGLSADGTDKKKNTKKLGITRAQRQWYQIAGVSSLSPNSDVELDMKYLRDEMDTWCFPFHFVDFETTSPALPYSTGKSPFDLLAFQFSHHMLHENGEVEHVSEFLHAVPGECPNSLFLDAFSRAMGDSNKGTVFRWGAHENTVLSTLLQRHNTSFETSQVLEPLLSDGSRAMVDLMQVATKSYFVAGSGASSSIKNLLLPTMRASEKLRRIYGEATYSSRNFSHQQWWQMESERGGLLDPYSLLGTEDKGDRVADGGDAIVAYNVLQQINTNVQTRAKIEASLLRYCELDTLAMIMIVQAWQGFLEIRG